MYGDPPADPAANSDGDYHGIIYTPSGSTEGLQPRKMSELSATWVEFWCEAFRNI